MTRAFRGNCLGCLVTLAFFYIAASSFLFVTGPFPGAHLFSPILLLDPSDGPVDEPLIAALEHAFVALGAPQDWEYPDNVAVPEAVRVGFVDRATFTDVVRGVTGWDLIVPYRPYQYGLSSPLPPTVTSWFLKRRLERAGGALHDEYVWFRVVRGQAVVGDFWLEGDIDVHGVVTYTP